MGSEGGSGGGMEWEREEGWTDLDEGGVAWAGIRRADIGECLGPTPKGPDD